MNLDQHLDMDSTKIRSDLGYKETIPRPRALEMTLAWDREHPLKQLDGAQFDYAAEDSILNRLLSHSAVRRS